MKYEGNFKDGKFDGKGSEYWASGKKKYEGVFIKDEYPE